MNPGQSLVPVRDPKTLRRRQPYNEPLPATLRWIDKLPAEVRPIALFRSYPRIANTLARAWGEVVEFQICLDELLVDRRGGRQGFPVEVLDELLTLRDYFQGRYPQLPIP